MKPKKQKVTVNVLSDKSGIDRRTVKKRLIEAGLFPCDEQPLAKCLAAIKPAGTGSTTLESAKAKLIEAKVRQIEREEQIRGGDVLPTMWFVACVNEAFQDRIFNCISNVFDEAAEGLKNCRVTHIPERYELRHIDDANFAIAKEMLSHWLEYARKSMRISVDTSLRLLLHELKKGTPESGGKTSYGEMCDFMESIAKELSDSAHAEMMTAIRAARSRVSESK